MCPNLHHHTRLVPLLGIVAVLILDEDVITNFQWRKMSGSVGQSLLHVELPLAVGLCSLVSSDPPVLSGDKLARLERESVTENTAEDNLGRTETSDGTGSISVNQYGLANLVSVEAAGLRSVASDDPLGMFYRQFRSLVGSGVIG